MMEPHRESLEAIARRLEELQLALGYDSQASFARAIDPRMSPQKWSSYLRGTLIPVPVANLLCRKFRVDLNWVYHGDEANLPHALVEKIKAVRMLREGHQEAKTADRHPRRP